MKSTVVIYEHEHETGKADAKRIAYLLGAQTTCTRHVEPAIVDSVENFILCVSTCGSNGLSPEWGIALDSLERYDLTAKTVAVFISLGEGIGPGWRNALDSFCYRLSKKGARIMPLRPTAEQYENVDEWICSLAASI